MGLFNARYLFIEPLKLKRQSLVVDPELVEDGGIHISNVNGILDDVISVLVRFSVFETSLNARAG